MRHDVSPGPYLDRRPSPAAARDVVQVDGAGVAFEARRIAMNPGYILSLRDDWPAISDLLDEALALPPHQRDAS